MTRINRTACWFAEVVALSIGGNACARSPCTQPDVLAFVNQSRQSYDIDAMGITQSPIVERRLPLNVRTTVCSAWMLSRNPAWKPGGEQPHYIRVAQSFWVSKLQSGYEVGLIAPPTARQY